MGRTSFSGPVKSAAGFETGTGGSESTGTHVTVIDGDGNITVPAGSSVAGAVPYTLTAVSITLTAAQSGSIIGIATDAKTITLPAAAAGLTFTIINTGAAANNIVDVIAPDGAFIGSLYQDEGTALVGVTAATTMSNTKLTALAGDYIQVVCDGTNWYIVGGVGIWAQKAP